jgi:hypothetical protein
MRAKEALSPPRKAASSGPSRGWERSGLRLWHEVREAWGGRCGPDGDLLALSDIETRRTISQSLSQMLAVGGIGQVQALEKSLLEAEGEDAWNFARLGPSADLEVRVERQLKTDLTGRMQRLDLLTRTIAEWARGPVANRMVRGVG